MKIVKYELSLVQKKELILTMEDNVDSENRLKIFQETQVKEEKEQDGLIGIIAEKVSEESCTEQCESCQKYCPASEECMATDENVRCTECEYLCKTCGRCELKEMCIRDRSKGGQGGTPLPTTSLQTKSESVIVGYTHSKLSLIHI